MLEHGVIPIRPRHVIGRLFCYRVETAIVVSDPAPRFVEHPSVRGRRAREAGQVWPVGEAKHRAAPIARDRFDRLHHVAHALLVRRHEQHGEIVDAEMVVDCAGGDDLAISSDLRLDDGLDALGAHVGLLCEVALADGEQRVRFDPSRCVRNRRHGDIQRIGEGLRAGR